MLLNVYVYTAEIYVYFNSSVLVYIGRVGIRHYLKMSHDWTDGQIINVIELLRGYPNIQKSEYKPFLQFLFYLIFSNKNTHHMSKASLSFILALTERISSS